MQSRLQNFWNTVDYVEHCKPKYPTVDEMNYFDFLSYLNNQGFLCRNAIYGNALLKTIDILYYDREQWLKNALPNVLQPLPSSRKIPANILYSLAWQFIVNIFNEFQNLIYCFVHPFWQQQFISTNTSVKNKLLQKLTKEFNQIIFS